MAIQFVDGAILFVDGAIAMHEDCCCPCPCFCCSNCGELGCPDVFYATISRFIDGCAIFNGSYVLECVEEDACQYIYTSPPLSGEDCDYFTVEVNINPGGGASCILRCFWNSSSGLFTWTNIGTCWPSGSIQSDGLCTCCTDGWALLVLSY